MAHPAVTLLIQYPMAPPSPVVQICSQPPFYGSAFEPIDHIPMSPISAISATLQVASPALPPQIMDSNTSRPYSPDWHTSHGISVVSTESMALNNDPDGEYESNPGRSTPDSGTTSPPIIIETIPSCMKRKQQRERKHIPADIRIAQKPSAIMRRKRAGRSMISARKRRRLCCMTRPIHEPGNFTRIVKVFKALQASMFKHEHAAYELLRVAVTASHLKMDIAGRRGCSMR
ncbi:hypothetical protein R3P38DRAFT_2757371 [Favolaschia claudopus]|uniref:Uncharacterized protein n=1 Tax=Favolaschia claudopus TaxID=2862362 RepID=A0AAW0EHN2_9AGAR